VLGCAVGGSGGSVLAGWLGDEDMMQKVTDFCF
jgi:hypothetical protein